MPALAFLESLPDRAKAQFKARFEQIVEVGSLRTPEQFRVIRDEGHPAVGEIKAPFGPGYRLYAVREGTTWCLLTGAVKPSDRQVIGNAAEARRMYRESRGLA